MNETRIDEIRKSRGWTQERLAEESGVAVRRIQRLESGQDASLTTLTAIALGVPVREFFASVERPEFQTALDGLDAKYPLSRPARPRRDRDRD